MRSRSLARFAAAALATLPVLAVLGTASPAHADAAPVARPDAALDWLAGELAAHDGMLTISFGGPMPFPDQGLTIDAILAELAGGHGDDPAVAEAIDAVDEQLNDYLTQGSPEAGDWGSKAAAKSLLLQEVLDQDLGGPGIDLEDALRGLIATQADHDDDVTADALHPRQPGRFYDANLAGFGEYGNTLGQALAILALDRTSGGVPAEAVDYLLTQQCTDGSFRLYPFGYQTSYGPDEFVEDETCEDPSEGDTDATALALSALLTQPGSTAIDDAIDGAVDHLLGQQQGDGGFLGTGSVNANSTGLASAALRAAGETAAADAGAEFLAGVQVTGCEDLGALAYDQDAFDAGIDADREQADRATAQGALGLGLPDYAGMGSVEPVDAGLTPIDCDGVVPTSPKATVTASVDSVTAGGTLDLHGEGFQAGEKVKIELHSTPIVLGTATAAADGSVQTTVTIPADVEPGNHTIVMTGETSGTSASVPVTVDAPADASGSGTLPVTGAAHSGRLAAAGLGLVVLGAGLLVLSRERRLRLAR